MGIETNVAKNVMKAIEVTISTAAEIAKALDEFLTNRERTEINRFLLEHYNAGGKTDFVQVDPEVFSHFMEKELKENGVAYEFMELKDQTTGEAVWGIIYPDTQRDIVDNIRLKVIYEHGLTSEIAKEDLLNAYKYGELNVIKNIDMDTAYRIGDYAKNHGLTVCIEQNDDATCTIYSPKSQTSELAMAYVLSEYEMNTSFATYIKEKNDYENRLQNEINQNIIAEKEFYIVTEKGYPSLHIDDEKCVYSFRDNDGNIQSKTVMRDEDLANFNAFVGSKMAEMDDYKLLSFEEYIKNEYTKGEYLKEKFKLETIKEPDGYEEMTNYLNDIKNEYRENYITNNERNQNKDLGSLIDDFYLYSKYKIEHADITMEQESMLFDDLERRRDILELDLVKGEELMPIVDRLEDFEKETHREIDIEEDINKSNKKEKFKNKNDKQNKYEKTEYSKEER